MPLPSWLRVVKDGSDGVVTPHGGKQKYGFDVFASTFPQLYVNQYLDEPQANFQQIDNVF